MAALGVPDSMAALGGDLASVEADQGREPASRQIVPFTNYTVYEIHPAPTRVLREYVSSEGVVFAVSWRGPTLPNLRELLGAYFDEYTAALQATQRADHRSVVVRTPDLTVESSGQMRAFYGRAYLPQKLPQGVSSDDIK
jgi:hypothetical protein